MPRRPEGLLSFIEDLKSLYCPYKISGAAIVHRRPEGLLLVHRRLKGLLRLRCRHIDLESLFSKLVGLLSFIEDLHWFNEKNAGLLSSVEDFKVHRSPVEILLFIIDPNDFCCP